MFRSIVAAGVLSLVVFSAPVLAVGPGKNLTWPGGGSGKVVFDGDDHDEEGFSCVDCHPAPFTMKHGTAKMTMGDLNAGLYCGVCHNGRRAFAANDPEKCQACHRTHKTRGTD